MKRFFTALMTGLAAVIAIVSCEQPQEQEITVTQVNVTPASLALTEGETASLRAEVLPSDATNRSVAWASSAPAVASVSDAGTVTAVAPGTATITATAGGKKGSCTVVVSAKVVEVESITLSAIELEIERGATAELKATVNPPGATFGEIVWSSSDEAVAKVAGGVLTAVGPGSATVTATVNGKSAACDVTVVVSLRAAEIEVPSYRLVEGQSQEVNIVLTPADATGVVITWASSDNSVVTVDSGVMEAVGPGTATITVTINGTETKFAMVVEKKVIPVSEVTIDKPEVTLVEGESTLVTATVAPADATDPAVTWTSLNPEVAGVADGLITARKPGKATITAKAGDKLATCVVTVEKKFVPVATVTLNRTDMALVEGETGSLTATVGPLDATDPTVVWASTNPGIASVAGGVVTAVSPGTATITATAGDVTAACEVSVSKKFIPVSEISLDFTELPLTKGQTATLKATVGPADATDKTVSWSSSNPAVASVENGVVTALAGGIAVITAKAGDKTAVCGVLVTVPVESVTLSQNSIALEEGGSATLTAIVKPSDATDPAVTWSSSNAAVAAVSGGVVTAVSEGNAVITATAGGKSATCNVVVSKKIIPVSGITLDKTTLTLDEEQTATLVATVSPSNATDPTVTWSTSKASVATVNNGVVTAVAEGTATITAKAGDKTATCTVTVNKKIIPVSSVSLNKTTLTLDEGQSATLTATVSPSNATDPTVTWSTSKASVATVNNGVVTAVAEGTATITAKAGDKTATCAVTVKKKIIPVSSITLNQTTLTLDEEQSATLTATVNPSNATDPTVTWSTSKASVATVNNGVVTAVAEGTATITAKAGDKTATCTVTVKKPFVPVTGISVSYTTLNIKVGQKTTLTATVKPSNATNPTVTWTSSDESVATVAGGVVTGVGPGTADITFAAGEISTGLASGKVTITVTAVNPDDPYESADYSADGTVHTLQTASEGAGINIVLMGDAYTDRLIEDGTYATVMNNAMEAFFEEEPYKTYRNCFNVYYIDVVSKNEIYTGETALNTKYEGGTHVSGDDDKVMEYVEAVVGSSKKWESLAIVMMNRDYIGGTCYMYCISSNMGDWGRGYGVAYFSTSHEGDYFKRLLWHEAGGHGFAKLADEYVYSGIGAITASRKETYTMFMNDYGWYPNVDFTSNAATVKWHQFLEDSRYASENLGVFEGGATYETGVWRPTANSIMRDNTGGFNAPSRYAIWRRIHKLAYGESWSGTYEQFVTYDLGVRSSRAARAARRANYVEKPIEHTPPVVRIIDK